MRASRPPSRWEGSFPIDPMTGKPLPLGTVQTPDGVIRSEGGAVRWAQSRGMLPRRGAVPEDIYASNTASRGYGPGFPRPDPGPLGDGGFNGTVNVFQGQQDGAPLGSMQPPPEVHDRSRLSLADTIGEMV